MNRLSNRCLAAAGRRARRAFTLVEMLVVLAIIAMLAALGTVGLMAVMTTAKQTRMKIELDQIDLALRAYKEKYGSYPPCDLRMSNDNGIRAHVAQAFPRYNLNHLTNDLAQTGVDRSAFHPEQALVLWLKGFGPDPQHPFLTVDGRQINNGTPDSMNKPPVTPQFAFDPTRLIGYPNNIRGYFPPGSKREVPFVFFDGATLTRLCRNPMSGNWDFDSKPVYSSSYGTAAPYIAQQGSTKSFVNVESCQLIGAGVDDNFGSGGAMVNRIYPEGTGYDTSDGDNDNVANFCPKSRLEDAKP